MKSCRWIASLRRRFWLNLTVWMFSFSSWIMWQQQFTSQTKTSTATWFRGTASCCFTVNESFSRLRSCQITSLNNLSLRSRLGPPGTGKTSLCKALAQKLSIRLSSRWDHVHFRGLNSSGSFHFTARSLPPQVFVRAVCGDKQSQFVLEVVFRGKPSFVLLCKKEITVAGGCVGWFSLIDLVFLLQSGKLVTKMFQKIQQLIIDKDALVFVLIDEVWSNLGANKNTFNPFSALL